MTQPLSESATDVNQQRAFSLQSAALYSASQHLLPEACRYMTQAVAESPVVSVLVLVLLFFRTPQLYS